MQVVTASDTTVGLTPDCENEVDNAATRTTARTTDLLPRFKPIARIDGLTFPTRASKLCSSTKVTKAVDNTPNHECS